jgi:hypothetical protein
MGRTGHRFEAAIRKYKHSNSVIQGIVSKALDPPKITKFEDAPIPAMNQELLKKQHDGIGHSRKPSNFNLKLTNEFFISSHESVI